MSGENNMTPMLLYLMQSRLNNDLFVVVGYSRPTSDMLMLDKLSDKLQLSVKSNQKLPFIQIRVRFIASYYDQKSSYRKCGRISYTRLMLRLSLDLVYF